MSASPSSDIDAKHTLYDVSVSNNGARCRIILYKKSIPLEEGKMPLLTINTPTEDDKQKNNNMAIPESDTIARYLLSEYELYKATPPFDIYRTLSDAIAEFKRQLVIIDDILPNDNDGGPYLFGSEVSLADATIFPTMVFAKHMIPKFEKDGNGKSSPLPTKINDWYEGVTESDPVFKKVQSEVQKGLDKWEANNRWDDIFLAGYRDTHPPTLFESSYLI